jgi:hypothetical protein
MKRCLTVLALAFISVSGQRVSAQFPDLSTLPFTNSYETTEFLQPGDSIISNVNVGTWDARSEGSVAYVTNVSYTAAANYPLQDVTHSNIMLFSTEGGEVVNTFDTNSTKLLPEIWIDTMIQPVFSEELPMTASVTNSQLSICFLSTNGYNGAISLYHGAFDKANVDADENYPWSIQADTNLWSTFLGSQVISGQWVRLSVVLHYDDFTQSRPCFRVLLNGMPVSNGYGFEDTFFMAQTGSWFRCTTVSKFNLSEIALSGTGGLDDLLVSATEPIITLLPTIAVQSTGKGSVTPSGVLVLPADDASTNFVLQAAPYWAIAQAWTGNVPTTISNTLASALGQNSYEFTWSNIVGDHTLVVDFAALVASNGIPYEWLAANGLGTNEHASESWDTLASGDWDNDSMSTLQEWVTGTNPTDSNSFLRILGQTMSGDTPVLSWLSSTGTLNHTPYTFQMSSNLVDEAEWITFQSMSANVQGTNTVTAPPVVTPSFYRVKVIP